ncbi:acyclic terpene utilization AtuA family protein [Rhodococcus aerolatus]
MSTPRRPLRVAGFSGYLGDRATALAEAVAGDPVDVLVGDYLAEVTLAALVGRTRAAGGAGYVPTFLAQLRPHLGVLAQRGTKVVVNAGGLDPAGMAVAVRELAEQAGAPLRVAHVEGDDLLARLPELHAQGHGMENLDTGAPLKDWDHTPVAANAYLGGFGIAAALAAGADVVVCGRVTDASLVVGPAVWWHGWAPDDWDALAGAVVAGHLVECGPHATGGNFSGFAGVPGMLAPGFPVAEVAADGSSVVTKHARDGGTVTVDTVTAQLLYEIQGPRYLNPDVTTHLDDVTLTQAGPDRVAVTGVVGSPPSPTTKVAVFAPIGFARTTTVFVTGLDVAAKVDLLRAQVGALLGPDVTVELTPLGTPALDPATQDAATVPVRVVATSTDAEALGEPFLAAVGSLFLGSIPGFYVDTLADRASRARVRVDYWPALLPVEVPAHVVVLDDGRRLTVDPPPSTLDSRQPVHPEPTGTVPGPTTRAPLGVLVHARSGDKGGNSGVGLWVADDRAWEWLRRTVTVDRVRALLPEAAHLEVVRHELPRLRAVHLVLRGLLGTGGSSGTRVDQVGKAVGEHLRSRWVDVPDELLATVPLITPIPTTEVPR